MRDYRQSPSFWHFTANWFWSVKFVSPSKSIKCIQWYSFPHWAVIALVIGEQVWFLPLISNWEVVTRILIFCGYCLWHNLPSDARALSLHWPLLKSKALQCGSLLDLNNFKLFSFWKWMWWFAAMFCHTAPSSLAFLAGRIVISKSQRMDCSLN